MMVADPRVEDPMDAHPDELIPYRVAIARSGLSRRQWFDRVREAGVVVYVDGVDRRHRLIAESDIPKLTRVRPVQRREIESETV